jgi:hypothetical protein
MNDLKKAREYHKHVCEMLKDNSEELEKCSEKEKLNYKMIVKLKNGNEIFEGGDNRYLLYQLELCRKAAKEIKENDVEGMYEVFQCFFEIVEDVRKNKLFSDIITHNQVLTQMLDNEVSKFKYMCKEYEKKLVPSKLAVQYYEMMKGFYGKHNEDEINKYDDEIREQMYEKLKHNIAEHKRDGKEIVYIAVKQLEFDEYGYEIPKAKTEALEYLDKVFDRYFQESMDKYSEKNTESDKENLLEIVKGSLVTAELRVLEDVYGIYEPAKFEKIKISKNALKKLLVKEELKIYSRYGYWDAAGKACKAVQSKMGRKVRKYKIEVNSIFERWCSIKKNERRKRYV